MFLFQLCVPWVLPEGNNEGLSSSLHLSSYVASLPFLWLVRFHPDKAILGLSAEESLKGAHCMQPLALSLSFQGLTKYVQQAPISEIQMAPLQLQS